MAERFFLIETEDAYSLAYINEGDSTILITQQDDPLLTKEVSAITIPGLIAAGYREISAYKFMKAMLRIGTHPSRPPGT